MFDAKKLLDQFLGSQVPGAGGTVRDRAGQVTQLAKDNPLATVAIAGVLLGTDGGRKVAGSALKLGSRSLGPDSSAQKTMRYLEDLRDKTLQTVALCARSGQHYVVTLELLSLEPIKFSRGVGATFALVEDAPGAAILAFDNIGNGGSFRFSPDEADAGYAYSCSNTLPRVASVAAPILRSGQMPSAVCLSWVLDRSDNDDMVRRRYGAQVVACAQRLAHI